MCGLRQQLGKNTIIASAGLPSSREKENMYPLSAEELAVGELVQHWHRSIPEHPPTKELYSVLLQAYWKGELKIHPPSTSKTIERVRVLRVLHSYVCKYSQSQDLEIAFYEREDELPPETVELPDGSVEWDSRTRIRLPHDRKHWLPDMEARAFEQLEKLEYEQYPLRALTVFRAASVDRDVFGRLCDLRGWPRPSFWFCGQRSAETRRSLASARSRARKWLRDQTRSAKRKSKEDYWAEAHESVPGLSRRSFENVWSEVVPPSWRHAGTPKRSLRRGD
jgi:hypothetical protein